MSKREIVLVEQPCVLCEGTLEVWRVLVDEETRQETIEVDRVDHSCPEMKALLKERCRGQYRWD